VPRESNCGDKFGYVYVRLENVEQAWASMLRLDRLRVASDYVLKAEAPKPVPKPIKHPQKQTQFLSNPATKDFNDSVANVLNLLANIEDSVVLLVSE